MIAFLAALLPLAGGPAPAATAQFVPGLAAAARAQERELKTVQPAGAAKAPRRVGGAASKDGRTLGVDVRSEAASSEPMPASRTAAQGARDGAGQNVGNGPSWSQTAGSITKRPGPPPDPNVPPEALPGGGQALLFYEVHIGGFGGGTQTGYAEDFFVYAPAQNKPRPLLVVFHKYGVGHLDAWLNTEFFQEAVRKGWHIVAPLSASGVHMGSAEGQKNTETVIEWALDNFNINTDRIYGLGFSMGAGAAVNFAARHLDHNNYSFAAVLDHTGGIAHEDTYAQSPGTQFVFDFWFGNGSPGSTDPFLMARSCLLDFQPDTLAVDPKTNLARNLVTVPIKVTRASFEPQSTAYLQRQCDVFVSHLTALGGKVVYEIVPFFGHTWDMLDERAAVDWLGVHTLKVPTQHATLADGNRRYYHFDVVQDAAGAFTPFTWDLDTAQNKLSLSATENLATLVVDVASAGLSTSLSLELNLSTADNFADDVVFKGWPSNPTAVHRDGVQQFVNWVYNASLQELVIQEFDGSSAHQWIVTP